MRKYIVETIGTFFFVLTIGLTVTLGYVFAAIAIGSILMTMIFAGAHISGAHYNPAATIGIWLRGRCPKKDIIPYIVAQLIGAALAACVVKYLKAVDAIRPWQTSHIQPAPAMLVEFLFTFALVYVILNVATSKSTTGNSFYGLAIGFTVFAGAAAVGNISSAAFNPAVAFGAAIMGLIAWTDMWIYPVANFLGAIGAAFTFNYLNPDDK